MVVTDTEVCVCVCVCGYLWERYPLSKAAASNTEE